MSDLPEPLTPPDCDLRDFQHMQLDVRRLLTSETWMTGTGDQKAAALTLWMESWHQVPAASLPDNQQMLSILSQSGGKWTRVRAHALRGWVKCSDGRLYHPVVAEKALAAWDSKKRSRAKRENDAERLRIWREQRSRNSGEGVSETDMKRVSEALETSDVAEREGEGEGEGYKKEEPPNPLSGGDCVGDLLSAEAVALAAPTQPDLIQPRPVVAVAAKGREKKSERAEPEGFAEFYEAYPRKDKRMAAARAFPGAVKAAGSVEALMRHLRAFEFPAEKKFAPHPATWLNERRWRDREGVAESTPPSSAAPAYDARYWDLPLEEVAMLPPPRPGSPEFNAWDSALQGMRWPRPGSRSNNL